MAYNAYNQDEKSVEKSKTATMLRLFGYLLEYKWRIAAVLMLMGAGTAVSLLNPLFIRAAVDRYIATKDMNGLVRLVVIAGVLNILMILAIKARMLIMAKTSNKVIEELRGELFAHIQSLDLHFFDSRPSGKILAWITGDVMSL